MKYYSVEKLAALCMVDRETIRRWRKNGVNGVKLKAMLNVSHRGKPLSFSEYDVKQFMAANPKYVTKELYEELFPKSEQESNDEDEANTEDAEDTEDTEDFGFGGTMLMGAMSPMIGVQHSANAVGKISDPKFETITDELNVMLEQKKKELLQRVSEIDQILDRLKEK